MSLIPTSADIEYMKNHVADTKVPGILAVNIAGLLIVLIAVALRFVSRRLVRAHYGTDDWTIVFAAVLPVVPDRLDEH